MAKKTILPSNECSLSLSRAKSGYWLLKETKDNTVKVHQECNQSDIMAKVTLFFQSELRRLGQQVQVK